MPNRIIAALSETLRPHVGLSKSRLETLGLLMVGALGARTVNLGHIATERASAALPASTYRRLQRFFQHVRLDPDWSVPVLAAMIGSGPWTLALDRAAWKIGRTEVNFLVLAVVTRRFRVPLFRTLLPGAGNSSTEARIDLVRRYLAQFPVASIRVLLGDREFVGADWLKFLSDNSVPACARTCASPTRREATSRSTPACAAPAADAPSVPGSARARRPTAPAPRCSPSPSSASRARG